MGAFAAAAAVLAADPNRSEAGTFLPQTTPTSGVYGAGEVCRVLFHEPGKPQQFDDVSVWHPGVGLFVFHAELSRRPAKADRLAVRSTTYQVAGIRDGTDALGHWSHLDVDRVG
jgi:hypothetical protein